MSNRNSKAETAADSSTSDEVTTSCQTIAKPNVVRSPLWEEVAHLYLGCEVIGTYNDASGSRGYLTGITNGGTECEIQFIEEDGFNVSEEPEFNDIKEVKPILRRLETISADEDKEAWNIWNDDFVKKSGTNCGIAYEAGKIKYLLSKHFDCFGLIDAGHALDLSTVSKR
jgi:hypothetical protein